MLVALLLALAPGWGMPQPALDLPRDEDDDFVLETMAVLEANPLDINRVGPDELLAIPWLDPVLAWRLVAYRDSVGRFRSLQELRQVPGLTGDWLRLLEPYLTVRDRPEPMRVSGRLTLKTDALPPARDRWAGSAAVTARRGPWTAALTAENDLGEPTLPDWLGGSVAFDAGKSQLCAGDYTFGSALGLVFSGPHRRFADRAGTTPRGPSFVRPLGAPLEGRALRGLAGEYARGGWTMAGFGSWAARSAVLGDDGAVRRVRYDGRHDDSLTLAGRQAVDEYAAGARAGYGWRQSRLGLNLGRVEYAPGIAPAESLRSFHGRALSFGSVGFDWLSRPYRLAAELAGSTGGGVAAAAAVEGTWDGFRLALGAEARQARYFAPLGRWQSTTGRYDRVSARARVRWNPGPVAVSVAASSYRDYLADSLPARLGGEVAVPFGPVRLALGLEERYRLDEPLFRRAHAALRWQPVKQLGLAVEYEDGHPAAGPARGRALALRAELGVGPVKARAGVGRFEVAGNARMYFSEPAVFGPSRVYSTAADGWRWHGAVGTRLGPGRVGLSAGYAAGPEPDWDMAFRLEAGS
ncbi:MAG: helix-hairpin-helix domain-containing protein [bacterium]